MIRVTDEELMVIVTGLLLVLAGFAESVALTVMVEVPAVVGVPVSEQLLFRVSPAGSDPVTNVQVYGAVPPVTPMLPV
jgi:hypothetical protein